MSAKTFFKTLAAIAAMAGITGFAVAYASTEVAKVNGKVISLEDLNQKYTQSLQYYQPKAPSKKGLLDDLIKRELGIQEAKKTGLDKDPVVIEAINTVLFNALIGKKLTKEFENMEVTDSEGKDYYSRNPEIRTSTIFVAVAPNASADDAKKARDRLQKIYDDHIKPGKESFAEVAQRFSEGAAAPMGGDLDWKMKGAIDPAYYEAAAALKSPGRISGIVRSQAGFHIIKLTAVRTWEDVDRAAIKRLLLEERQRQSFERYMSQLRAQSKVTVHSELIKD